MATNDFDVDYDYESELGFDPNTFLSGGDDDLDLSDFLEEEPGADYGEVPTAGFEDYDMDEADDYQDENLAQDFPVRRNVPDFGGYSDETAYSENGYEESGEYAAGEYAEDGEYTEEGAYAEDGEYTEEGEYTAEGEYAEEGEYSEDTEAEEAPKKRGLKLPSFKKAAKSDKPSRRERPKKQSAFSKLLDLYMEPVNNRASEADDLDPLDPKVIRRKKREKKRIFKEVYLPVIIAGVALFLILSFFVGSVANLVRLKRIEHAANAQEQQNQASAAQQAELEYQQILAEVDRLAKGYDYDAAIAVLTEFGNRTGLYQQEITEKRAALVNEQAALLEWKDISAIPNLSFHVLIADPVRAFDKNVSGDLHGSYNRNFVTCDEFLKILNQLYMGNYVLVDYNSFISSNTGVDGNASFFPISMFLPAGKKPIMITETMVNYFEYMVDGDKDHLPDAKGHGFANKLVVDENGDIRAEYIDASGNTLVGNYDLVPILEDFIKEHPDFSYRGARAILAVTGDEGVFGYRTNTSYVQTMGQPFYDEQVVAAKRVVAALREKGYTLASYTYSNAKYMGMSTAQIQAEMTNWTNQVTPVLGDVDVMVFARSSDIDSYSGTSFGVLYSTGFRYFMNSGTSPRVDANTTFIKQTRLMVTGENMAWYASTFSSYFDCNVVLDLSVRGNVPKS